MLVVLGLFVVGLSTGVAAERPSNAKDVFRYWLTPGTKTISRQRIDQIFRIFKEDAETNELLKQVAAKLGTSDPGEIYKIVSICEDLPKNTAAAVGYAPVKVAQYHMPSDTELPQPLRFKPAPGARMVSQKSVIQDALYVTTAFQASICVAHNPQITVLDAYLDFAHELTHFVNIEPGFDMLSYANADEYARAVVNRKGGELDAYAFEFRTAIKLVKRIDDLPSEIGKLPSVRTLEAMSDYFDSSGRVTDRAGLTEFILHRLGYLKTARKDYLRLLTVECATLQPLANAAAMGLVVAKSEEDVNMVTTTLKNIEGRGLLCQKRLAAAGVKLQGSTPRSE